jgi:hypothetical protein
MEMKMTSSDHHQESLLPVGATEEPRSRPIDPCWEALVRETAENPHMARGKLNVALKAIREACFSEGLIDAEACATEIGLRARAYRERFPACALTPTALATHWFRVMVKPVNGSSQDTALEQARHLS